MSDENLDSRAYELDAFSEFDASELEEWDSLKDLLSELDERERAPIASGSFGLPALLGDGEGIARWVLRLSEVRRLSRVTSLLHELPRAPWCIAVRVIAIDADAIRVGVTTTRRVERDYVSEYVAQLLGGGDELRVAIEPVMPSVDGERWLTVEDVAHEFAVEAHEVQRWIDAGLLVTRQVATEGGSEWRIRLRPATARQEVGA